MGMAVAVATLWYVSIAANEARKVTVPPPRQVAPMHLEETFTDSAPDVGFNNKRRTRVNCRVFMFILAVQFSQNVRRQLIKLVKEHHTHYTRQLLFE
jgi:hypothetical protein